MIASVDGCQGGWLLARAAEGPELWPELQVCRTFNEVVDATPQCELVVVDMPIGLLETPGARECDRAARQLLGAAHSRVFNPLPRPVLQFDDYKSCNARCRERFGVGISRQSFGLRSKLSELDAQIRPVHQKRIREFHPELVWARLNGGRALPSKHLPHGVGLNARKNLLMPLIPSLNEWLERPRMLGHGVKEHDMLDALVGLELARRLVLAPAQADCLPANPPTDGRGLRMEIWY